MNKRIYLGIYIESFLFVLIFALASFVGFFLARGLGNAKAESLLTSLFSIAILGLIQFVIVSLTCTCIMLRKMWGAINDGHARTTPAKAIGFLFIPVFNIYWIFQVWGGFPADYNAYLDRYGLPAPRLPKGVYLTYPILTLLSALPLIGVLCAIAEAFVFLAIISKTCDAVNILDAAVRNGQPSIGHARLQNQLAAGM